MCAIAFAHCCEGSIQCLFTCFGSKPMLMPGTGQHMKQSAIPALKFDNHSDLLRLHSPLFEGALKRHSALHWPEYWQISYREYQPPFPPCQGFGISSTQQYVQKAGHRGARDRSDIGSV